MGKYDIINKKELKATEIVQLLDQSLLNCYYSKDEVITFCNEVKLYGFNTVALNSIYTELAAKELKDWNVQVVCPSGYPWGTHCLETKVFETENGIRLGAGTLDFMIHVGAAKAHDWDYVRKEIRTMVDLVKRKHGLVVKSIIETCYLTDEEIVEVSRIAAEEDIDYVKTSTGYGSDGATVHGVQIIKNTVGNDVGVKASGNVVDYASSMAFLQAGASRLGTSRGVAVLQTAPGWEEYRKERGIK